jgi:PAS domain S-box-containing protein
VIISRLLSRGCRHDAESLDEKDALKRESKRATLLLSDNTVVTSVTTGRTLDLCRMANQGFHSSGCIAFHQELRMVGEKTQVGARAEENLCGVRFAKNAHPMWVFDRETLAFLEVNEAATKQYGYSRDEFLANTIVHIRPAEDVPELLREDRFKGASTAATWRHRTKDGTVVSVSITTWELTYRGRPAELVLAHWNEPA